jgi:hypothetical protein
MTFTLEVMGKCRWHRYVPSGYLRSPTCFKVLSISVVSLLVPRHSHSKIEMRYLKILKIKTLEILIHFVLLNEIQFSLAKRKLQQVHETPGLLSHLKRV